LDNPAISQPEIDTVPVLRESNDTAVQSNGIALEITYLGRKEGMNIRAVHLVIRRAMQAFMFIGKRKSLNLFTGVMKAKDVGSGSDARLG
jgi:hypothetical protein